jgi:hypothetical protein
MPVRSAISIRNAYFYRIISKGGNVHMTKMSMLLVSLFEKKSACFNLFIR